MAEYPINDLALEHLYGVSIDVGQDLVGNAFVVHRRMQPVANLLFKPAQCTVAGATYVRRGNWTHRLSPGATAIRCQYFLLNNANANAALQVRYTHPAGHSGSIYLPSADGVTIAWGGAAFKVGTYDLSLADLKANCPDTYEIINVFISLKQDCEIESLYLYEVRV